MSTAVIPEIVEQHAEEAAFLWLLRDHAVKAPHYNLSDLAHLDDRVEAHIDGLRVSGEFGWELCAEAMARGEPGEGFAAGVLAFESGDRARVDAVFEAAAQLPELGRGIVSAFGWVAFDKVSPLLQSMVASDEPMLRRIAIAGCAIHRHEPFGSLASAIDHDDVELRARALRAAGELGQMKQVHRVRGHLDSDDETSRFFAARSMALLGERVSAGPVLVSLAVSGGYRPEEATVLAIHCMTPTSAEIWVRELAKKPETMRFAVIAAGASGNTVFVPSLLTAMATPALARVAGESFSMITGVDLAYDDLDGDWPEDFEAGPSDNPEDEDVAMDPDEDLAWPAHEAMSTWWESNGATFPEGIRHFLGTPVTTAGLEAALRNAFQRQRNRAAVELAMQSPDASLFETRATGVVQERLLS